MTIRFRCKCGRKFEVADSAAGRKARCTDCGLTFLVPSPDAQPAGAQAARPQVPRRAPRPAAPPMQRPTALDALYALQGDDDDVPMARLVPEPAYHRPQAHLHAREKNLTAVHVVMGMSLVVALFVIIDALGTMLSARQAGLHGVDLVYGLAALFAGIGAFVAFAAGCGNRFCIGILLGGAARNVLNGPFLLFMALSKSEIVTSQGRDAVTVCGVAGAVSLLAGVGYLLIPLLSRPVREHIGASYGAVIGGWVVGLLLGPLVVCTALPAPELVWARYVTTRRVGPDVPANPAGPGGSPAAAAAVSLKAQADTRDAMLEQMNVIHEALSEYLRTHSELPANLGLLVSDGCPSNLFVCPTRGATAMPRRNPTSGYFITRTDVVYPFQPGRRAAQLESIPNAAELIVAYSDPKCGLGDGALVMRLPRAGGVAAAVEWLDKATFDRQLAATSKWLADNPPREKPPGMPE